MKKTGSKKSEAEQTQISTWVLTKDLRRADALAAKLTRHEIFGSLGRVTKSAVLRLAITRGLDVLEKEHK